MHWAKVFTRLLLSVPGTFGTMAVSDKRQKRDRMTTKTMLGLFCALLALAAVSCQSGSFCRRAVRGLEGWDEARLIRKYGAPQRVETNTVAEFARSLEPYHHPIPEVLSMYPTNVASNLPIQIKSLSWQRGRIMLTASLHQSAGHWVTFYVEEWNMDVIE